MGILGSLFDSVGGALADQWKDVVTVEPFTDNAVVAPGVVKRNQRGRGDNRGSESVLSSGSVILVPENTAAVVFNRAGIECVFIEPGGYEYRGGETSVFDGRRSAERNVNGLIDQIGERFEFSGMPSGENRVVFVNLREIRGLKFGTRGPLSYNDRHYDADLEFFAHGIFSVQVIDPARFIQSFVPANVTSYSFDNLQVCRQLAGELLSSLSAVVSTLSEKWRLSQIAHHAGDIVALTADGVGNVGAWESRFGMRLVSIAIESIDYSAESRERIEIMEREAKSSATPTPDVDSAVDASHTANPADPADRVASMSLDDRIEALKKLKELVDIGILTQEEFDAKKRQMLKI